jgi:uncharacterized membrane protein YdfJ with MMPL/SSD domain
MFLFSILFGLSMDYEVFLMSRMREEYGRTGSNWNWLMPSWLDRWLPRIALEVGEQPEPQPQPEDEPALAG